MNAVMEMEPSNFFKSDKYLSFFISALIHGSIILIAIMSFIKPPVFAVDHGVSSIEVNLVAAPEVITPQPVPMPSVPVKSEFVEKQIVKPTTKIVKQRALVKTKKNDTITARSTRGAITEAKPNYLENPAPVYPELARQLGYEGIVFLTADINMNGMPVKVEIEKSSGHILLDQAALKAIKTWKFHPGEFDNMPIESVVRVPIRFYLEESK